MEKFTELGQFSDLVSFARQQAVLCPPAAPGPETRKRILDVLGFGDAGDQPHDVKVEQTWRRDGIQGEAVSWQVGYGPDTKALVLKPEGARGPLPGVIALHDHGAFKVFGKEKIADGPEDYVHPVLANKREKHYAGRAFANELAREGFVVLVHDVFLWGSRRFPRVSMPEFVRKIAATNSSWWNSDPPSDPEIDIYNASAFVHELYLEKYLTVLGASLAGLVSYEDRVAAAYLAGRPDVDPGRLGCVGLSGGGCRAGLLQATCDRIKASVIAGMMSTYTGLLDHNISSHTWMFFPPTLARIADWPDLAACRAPSPLLVQYDIEDDLFTLPGMQAAHERLQRHYSEAGKAENYAGQFYPGPHKFDLPMQRAAFDWLNDQLNQPTPKP